MKMRLIALAIVVLPTTAYCQLEKAASRDTTNEYFASGKLKSMTVVGKGNPSWQRIEYRESGAIKKKSETQGDHRVEEGFYENGKAHYVIYPGMPLTLMQYWDSLGVQLVKDGSGTCRCYIEDYDNDDRHREEGKVVNGHPDGTWAGYKNDKLSFLETYAGGKFIEGIRYADTEIRYTTLEQLPEFPGGTEEMYKFIHHNIKYPKQAKRDRAQGTVFVGFGVDQQGKLFEVKTIKGIHPSANAEAERVIALMPPWKPGYQRGLPVKVRFVLPLKFKLDR